MPSEKVMINVRVPNGLRDDFAIVAKHRGTSTSSLIYQFMLALVTEQRQMTPRLFPDFVSTESREPAAYDKAIIKAFNNNPPPPELVIKMLETFVELKEQIDKLRESNDAA
jgi:hypothetical protein